ncbi:hypothetical protein Tco_0210078 [Tanacetum coccineum]
MVDEFAPPKFFASIRGMDHDQLFTEFNVGAARQISLSAKVRMRAEYNIRERRRLHFVVEEKSSLLKARDVEIESLKAQFLVKKRKPRSLSVSDYNTTLEKEKSELDVKVADLVALVKVREQEAADLDAMVHELETSSAGLQEKVAVYENYMGKLKEFQDEQIRVMNDKFEKLYVDFVEMALHLEEKLYPHLLTTIVGRRWLLTYGVKLAIVKCLHLPKYLSALGAAISRAIDKGMDNVSNHRPAFRDVFVPLVEPLSYTALEGMEGTFGTTPKTTTALSVTFASTSSIPPISTDDYDVYADGQEGTGADGQAGVGVDVNPFPNVKDAKIYIS